MFEKILPVPHLTPESYTEELKKMLGTSLRSVILFGSASAGDHVRGKSDYNLLVIADRWGILELNLLAKTAQAWIRQGNPAPLTFTFERLQASADCFPIEMLDMKQSYRVLLGLDLLKEIKVLPVHLRLMTSREIKSLRIKLRQSFIIAKGDPRKVAQLMVDTLSSSLVLFRSALRLYTDAVPLKKYEVLPAVAERVKGLDVSLFDTLHQLKHGRIKLSKVNPLKLFDRYLEDLKTLDEAIDDNGRRN